MIGEKIKYNTPLPGVEFKSRDLTNPAEAAKVLYEIDFQYGQDKELCLSILSTTFRTFPEVTQVLQETAKGLQGGVRVSAWHHQAVVNRNTRVAVLERKIVLSEQRAKRVENEISLGKGHERRARSKYESLERKETHETPVRNLQQEFTGSTTPTTIQTPSTTSSTTSFTTTTDLTPMTSSSLIQSTNQGVKAGGRSVEGEAQGTSLRDVRNRKRIFITS